MTTVDSTAMIHDPSVTVNPLGDQDAERQRGAKYNRAKVGSARPSSLLYTWGPGSIVDLPNFNIMPCGYNDWDRIYDRRDNAPVIHAPKLRAAVARLMRSHHIELRRHPWQAKRQVMSAEGTDLGVPSRVFPQWLRCTGCDLLGPLSYFEYKNTHPYRPDFAEFTHGACRGRRGKAKSRNRTAIAARYLLVCANGHLDEFPYYLWVHRGHNCEETTENTPRLKMSSRTAGQTASATIECTACGAKRGMNEAQGNAGRAKLPPCRGRHPHLDAFFPCGGDTRVMLIGASNLWFPVTQSTIVMPAATPEDHEDLAQQVRAALGPLLHQFRDKPDTLRGALLGKEMYTLATLPDDQFTALVELAAQPAQPAAPEAQSRDWDPIELLVPEWHYLCQDRYADGRRDEVSGLTLSRRHRGNALPPQISRVLAVESLRKVNALIGFTRVDEIDRIGDIDDRLVKLTRTDKPKWTVATEDLGEGIFLQLDEQAVADWEHKVYTSSIWKAHTEAHERNFANRTSDTADTKGGHQKRFQPPRYWLVHGLAHILIRELAMRCGYNAASLSERLYAWRAADGRPAAAGLLICTTASDSDGTLGGLVQQSHPALLEKIVNNALRRATRCPSDPMCAKRAPREPEDFLHGAACHCCIMASETSCERANRFLDRRFLIDLPGNSLGFFALPE